MCNAHEPEEISNPERLKTETKSSTWLDRMLDFVSTPQNKNDEYYQSEKQELNRYLGPSKEQYKT